MSVLVTGAGGFVGGHLVRRLLDDKFDVRAVDLKPITQWHQMHRDATNWDNFDLSERLYCDVACAADVEEVYNLAADMGGMGFIENNKTKCMLNVLISTNMIKAAFEAGVSRFFYASSACVYNTHFQSADNLDPAMVEYMAYPAMPEDGYGWEKLFSERMCQHFTQDYGIETRVARYHNVYGPNGEWNGGREKAPAALCRKMIESKVNGTDLLVWGDGNQRRSFTYIDDAIEGTIRLMRSDYQEPINIGSDELVSIDETIDMLCEIADHHPQRVYDISAAQGVAARYSDNARILSILQWQPRTPLAAGLIKTYGWIYDQMREEAR